MLRSIKNGMTTRESASFYNISTSYIHSWKHNLVPKTTRKKSPTKISNEALSKDIEQHSDDYMYERTSTVFRLYRVNSDIETASKRLNINQKKHTITLENFF